MPIASPRYAFNQTMVSGAPPDPGVFALWEGEELIYYGRAHSIQARLQEHLPGQELVSVEVTSPETGEEEVLITSGKGVRGP